MYVASMGAIFEIQSFKLNGKGATLVSDDITIDIKTRKPLGLCESIVILW